MNDQLDGTNLGVCYLCYFDSVLYHYYHLLLLYIFFILRCWRCSGDSLSWAIFYREYETVYWIAAIRLEITVAALINPLIQGRVIPLSRPGKKEKAAKKSCYLCGDFSFCLPSFLLSRLHTEEKRFNGENNSINRTDAAWLRLAVSSWIWGLIQSRFIS